MIYITFTAMRLVKEVPHQRYKIQIFQYNGKYIVKIELGPYEQSYKIDELEVTGLEEVEKMINTELLTNSLHRFIAMRQDWEQAFSNKNLS